MLESQVWRYYWRGKDGNDAWSCWRWKALFLGFNYVFFLYEISSPQALAGTLTLIGVHETLTSWLLRRSMERYKMTLIKSIHDRLI